MAKHKKKEKRKRTRIHLVLGTHVDVLEDYNFVMGKMTFAPNHWVTLTLEDGDPVSFQRNWIAYITKR